MLLVRTIADCPLSTARYLDDEAVVDDDDEDLDEDDDSLLQEGELRSTSTMTKTANSGFYFHRWIHS